MEKGTGKMEKVIRLIAMKEILKMTKNVVKEFLNGLLGIYTKVIIIMT